MKHLNNCNQVHLDVRCGQTWHLSTYLCSGEKTGGQRLWSCYSPYSPAVRTWSILIYLPSRGHCSIVCQPTQVQSCYAKPVYQCGLWRTINHLLVVDSCPLSKLKGGLRCLYEWVSEKGWTSPSTHYRSFRRRVFPVNHLHWYRQPNKNKQETQHTNNTTYKVPPS